MVGVWCIGSVIASTMPRRILQRHHQSTSQLRSILRTQHQIKPIPQHPTIIIHLTNQQPKLLPIVLKPPTIPTR